MQLQQSTLLKPADEEKYGGSLAIRHPATSVWDTSAGCTAVSHIFKLHLLMKMFSTDRQLANRVPDPETTVHDMGTPTISVT